VLIVLVLLLAMVFLHAASEGHDAATELGAFCLAVLTVLGPIVLHRVLRTAPATVVPVRGDRGPPWATSAPAPTLADPSFALATPLRR
jgi:hypothetical protein